MTTSLTESAAKPLVNRGALRHASGDLVGAEADYRAAIEADPANATAHANLGYLLACLDRHAEAMDVDLVAIALEPERSAPWAHLGMSQVASGDPDAGLVSLARAVRLDVDNHFAWDAMGRTLLALGRVAEAESAWRSGVVAAPDDVDLLIAWAAALVMLDQTAEAAAALRRAVGTDPSSARAWVQLGAVCLVRQDHGSAGEALLTALDLDPDNPEARYHLALLHCVVGATDEARQELAVLAAPGSRTPFADEAAALLDLLDRRQ